MKRSTTVFLRLALAGIGIGMAGICIGLLPRGIADEQAGAYRWLLAGLYVPAIPFFIALFQAHRLLGYIDANTAFSLAAVRALARIKACALVISLLFIAGMPYVYYVADQDDAPGVIVIGLVIIGASFVIGAFAGLLQRLFDQALTLQSENDLTV
jgi:hypothetical protein